MERYVLIVAGGRGTRFDGKLPKQFALIKGKPVLLHTIEAFLRSDKSFNFILVLPDSKSIEQWKSVCKKHRFNNFHQIVLGGESRQQSVQSGLDKVPDNVLVAIHDGVRPFVTQRLIKEGFELASKTGSAVPVTEITETVRQIKSGSNKVVDRENLLLVQTPQFFQSNLIKQAYKNINRSDFTDDASIYENAGYKLTFFEGERQNIKITYPVDLLIAEALL